MATEFQLLKSEDIEGVLAEVQNRPDDVTNVNAIFRGFALTVEPDDNDNEKYVLKPIYAEPQVDVKNEDNRLLLTISNAARTSTSTCPYPPGY